MSADYDRLRELLLDAERGRLDEIDRKLQRVSLQFEQVPEILATDIERSLQDSMPSRLSTALSEATTGSLDLAVRRRPQAIVAALFPVMGPAIRRALSDAIRHMADDLDAALHDLVSLRALKWRLETWRTGVPYVQVVLRHSTNYQVEHMFLIHAASGLLLGHQSASGMRELDADAVAGMFTAIQMFMRDSVLINEAAGGLGDAKVGDYVLKASEGPHAWLVAFVRGQLPSDFSARLDVINEELHSRQNLDDLEEGQKQPSLIEQGQLDDLNRREAPALPGQALRWKWVVSMSCVLGVVLLAWLIVGYRWQAQVESVRARLSGLPGVVLLGVTEEGAGRLSIEAMLDPLAPDPRALVGHEFPKISTRWALRPYMSLEPDIIRRRIIKNLELPDSVNVSVDVSATARLAGQLPFRQWYELRKQTHYGTGAASLDMSALTYPQRERIERAVSRLEAVHITFTSSSTRPEPGMVRVLADLVDGLDQLYAICHESRISLRVYTVGSSDTPGTSALNRELREQRAQWLANSMADRSKNMLAVTVDQVSTLDSPQAGQARSASVRIDLLPEVQ